MADHLVDLARIAAPAVAELAQRARRLRLVPGTGGSLGFAPAQARAELAEFGRGVFRALSEGAGGELPGRGRLAGLLLPAALLPRDRLWLPADGPASRVPWEAARDDDGDWLGQEPAMSLVHRTRWGAHAPAERVAPARPSVLVVTAMPRGLPSANVELQRQRLTALAARFESAEGMFHWSENRDLALVRQEMAERRCDVLHVIAHGRPGRILWEDRHHAVLPYEAEEFCERLAGPEPSLVVLSVCDSASPPPRGRSLAAVIADRLAPAAVGMRATLDESAAALFVGALYEGLLASPGTSLDQMVHRGRQVLYRAAAEGSTDAIQWLLPTVVCRDGALRFDAGRTRRPRPAPPRPAALRGAAELRLPDGSRIPLVRTRTVIGRSNKADITFPSPSLRPFHAMVRATPSGYELWDLSFGGSSVNGIRADRIVLSNDDSLAIGPLLCRFVMKENTDGER
ncbi:MULTISPECIES: CHAT domain-containing protein [Streptomyces]|uniref:CHAT domain-containing protein n=1 Tax=Streptomyces edwardsiae TaxID=3075527 RepID=A0ABU2QE07_9ACTN|nr:MULTISPECIES: CHAT domain-containing protein [unclassified Streptomyces]MDT0402699.1 CHAT domain-containing protein [Streptomyces sp. DSM 41635]